MSVQLIVYPQNYEGFTSSNFNLPVEMLANGNDFVNVGDYVSSYPAPSSTLSQQAITALFPPTYFNTWYGYYTTTNSSSPIYSPPLDLVVLIEDGCGILQNLTNLTAGLVYNLEITVDTGTAFVPINIDIFNEDVLDTAIVTTPTSAVTTVQFTAPNDNFTVLSITNLNVSTGDSILIENISIMVAPTEPTILGDGQVILDLYEEEDLPLTLSVEDFKNVAENVASYSKAFNLPATKRNNKAFDSIFEITRDYTGLIFNPYQKTECVLKQDGLLLFKGYLRLLDVTDKLGEISYNVNLYSEVVALADALKDRAFRDLDFTELEHDYNYTEIRNSWQGLLNYTNAGTSGFRSGTTVRYPFVDWNHNYSVTNGGMTKLLTLESSFRPFINIRYLIDRIFEASDFTYESAFISSDADFNKLYMDFNWGADNNPVTANTTRNGVYYIGSATNYAPNGSFGNLALITNLSQVDYNNTTNKFTATTTNVQYNISYHYDMRVAITNSQYSTRWLLTRAATGFEEVIELNPMQSGGSSGTVIGFGGSISPILQTGDTLEAQFSSDTTNGIVQNYDVFGSPPAITANITVNRSVLSITTDVILQTLRGELGQWDFLKGLITMFNLVTLPDEDNPNNIIIEPYGDVFISTVSGTTLADRGIQHDWTNKIDVSEMKLEPLADLNKKTMFKFVEDDDDYAFNQYKRNVGGQAGEGGFLYGSNEWDAWNQFDILEGTKEIVAEPFAATLVKPLEDHFPEFITPAIYSMGDDGVSQGFENSPRIMYNNGVVDMASTTYSVPAQNGGIANALEFQFLQFSHLTDIPTSSAIPSTTIDFHFGVCQLMTGVGVATPNNLFELFWLPYYSQLYNPNTRVMTIKVNLNASDINLFKFNDKVFLKSRIFRVNKIDYKPNDLSTVEFILII